MTYHVDFDNETVHCDSKAEVWAAVEALQNEVPQSRWDEIEVYSTKDHAVVELVDLEQHGEENAEQSFSSVIYGMMDR